MSSLFGGKSREEREAEKQQRQAQLQHQQKHAAEQYDDMVTKALEQLTHWAFPDSQLECNDAGEWRLVHTKDNGEKYVDVTVTLEFDKERPISFTCDSPVNCGSAELDREDLTENLRLCICSR